VRYDHYSTFGSAVNPRLAAIYTPFDGTVLKFLYGSAFRAPNVYELHYAIPDLGQKGNPDLGPEKIKTYELVYEQNIGDRVRGTIAGFYYTIDDLIVQATDPADGLDQFGNLERVEAKGVEAELEAKWDSGLAGRASYTFQDARDSGVDRTLVNSPRHLAKLNLTIPLLKNKVFLGIEEQYTGRRRTLTGDHAGSFLVTNLTLFSRELLKGLELSASLYNLFDHRYGDPGGGEHIQDNDPPEPSRFRDRAHPLGSIQQDGRNFRVKLTYRF
jgi:iron complex outermembrane receptor protein